MKEEYRHVPRSALVAYGSETGNAQDVAEELGRLARRLKFVVRVVELDSIGLSDLLSSDIVLIAISTTGQGALPPNAQSFWKRLRSNRLRLPHLSPVRFASFGLGDSSYPQYNWAHRKLHNRLSQLGANDVCDRGESDEQHPEGIDGSFVPWCVKLKQALLAQFPLPSGIEPIADDVFLEPQWSLEPLGPNANGDGNRLAQSETVHGPSTTTSSGTILDATLINNERVTPETHWQDVRLLKFQTPHVDYKAGDVLTIFPKNFSEDVNLLLILLDWTAVADEPVRISATSPEAGNEAYASASPNAPLDRVTTIRELLTSHLDINAIPRRSFFASIAHFTVDETQRERLIEFTNPEFVDELYDYTTRPRRSIIEVLQEFHTVKLSHRWLLSFFPPIRGRQFSIASGGVLKAGPDNSTRFELLVAIVKYKTVIKKIRQGLCTRYLASLEPGSRLTVQSSKSGMKVALDRPALMIGPGTGVAPLRSMIYERAASPNPKHRQVLIFGNRNRSADFFFEQEWVKMRPSTGLQVRPAFSRDQTAKQYVQDIIRQKSRDVYELLRDGTVYVCGSSGKMPSAVREALIDVFESEAPMARSDAEAHLKSLEKEGRYQQETWG